MTLIRRYDVTSMSVQRHFDIMDIPVTVGHIVRLFFKLGKTVFEISPCYVTGGFSDSVRCFCCGLELRNWDNGNGAWSEHAKWSANCLYLKQNKSLEFFQIHRNTDNDAASAAACAADKSASQVCYA